MASESRIRFPLELGLHARPASLIQETASQFEADLFWENERARTRADCKSTLSLIASETRQNDTCRIVASGSDEKKATAALKKLVEIVLPRAEEKTPVQEIFSAGGHPVPRVIKKEKSLYFSGNPVNRGICEGTAIVFDPASIEPPPETGSSVIPEKEISALQGALAKLEQELISSGRNSQKKEERDIIKTHLSILRDKILINHIKDQILNQHCSATRAVYQSSLHFSHLLENNKSIYIRQRMADIKDISVRLIAQTTGNPGYEQKMILNRPSVLVTSDISPSQFITLDKKLLKGMALSAGGTSSHSLILARSYNIPTITGIPHIERKINSGESVILDGDRGLVVPSPSLMIRRFYEREIKKKEKKKAMTAPFIAAAGLTADKKKLEVAANTSSVEEIENAFAYGAEGIGLFRTEMIFMNRSLPPDEEEQFRTYSRAARLCGHRSLIIRTLDIGGDKPLSYLNLPEEPNPFLGRRGIRLYGEMHQLVDQQLRALLRASVFGNLKIMFPMVSCFEEVITLKKRVKKVMLQLKKRKIPFNPEIPTGIMVEIPSLAFDIEALCREIDFFSIGSNDLMQYFLAADRANPDLDYLSGSLYPSFLRLLKMIITAAHSHSRWIGICGEMAGDIRLLPVMVGLDFNEISLPSPEIPKIKFRLNQLLSYQCENLVSHLLRAPTAQEIEGRLTQFDANPVGSNLISDSWVKLDSGALSQEEAIRELVDLLDIAGRLTGCDEVEDAIWQRESEYSTGIGFGIAIPHCRNSRVRIDSIAFSRLKNPISWKSPDNQPVDTVILLALSTIREDKDHLKIISRLSRKLMNEQFRANLQHARKTMDIVTIINENLKD